MKLRAAAVALALLLCFATGCYRTHYVHLYGQNDAAPISQTGQSAQYSSSWQNFFIFGWVPGERAIDSGHLCGAAGVAEIQTRRSFLQGLVAAITSFYINIYSPWTGETVCRPG